MSVMFEILRERIREPLVLIDVGSHGGALDAWQAFGDKAKVFCFEARAEEVSDLVQSNTNKNVEYVSIALSDSDAPTEIFLRQFSRVVWHTRQGHAYTSDIQ